MQGQNPSDEARPLRPAVLLLGGLLVLAVVALGWIVAGANLAEQLPWAGQSDFVAYWAAGRLNLTGGNPYSASDLFALQQSVGWGEPEPLLLWTLPLTLTLVMPFAGLDYATAYLLWTCVNIVLLVVIADVLWRVYDGPRATRWLAPVVALLFAPTLMQLYMGQMGVVILAAWVGFLVAVRRERWWWAGAMLPFAAIKPHIAYLVWVLLAVWWLRERKWQMVGGALIAGGLAWLIPMLINPSVTQQYLAAAADTPPLSIGPTTWGTLLRDWLGWEREWLAFVPPLIGLLVWAIYWRPKSAAWSWSAQLPWLLLLSMSTMAFGWYHDFVLLLPALIQMLVWVVTSDSVRLRWVALGGFVLFEVAAYLVLQTEETYAVYFVWMAPVLLIAYWWLDQTVGAGRETEF